MVIKMDSSIVQIGNISVGDSYPTAFMAELSTYYNQDMDKAIYLIDKAIDAGSDILKTEILHDSNIVLEKANLEHRYEHAGGFTTENYRKLIERKTVPLEQYKKIINYVKQEKRVPFVASCYDFEGIDFLVENGADAIKLWKNNYNNFPLIKYAAKTGLPIIFDIADIYLDELIKIVRIAQNNGAGGVIVNHHPGKTPTPPEEHNLRLIQTYKNLLNVPVGLSCHYPGDEMLYVAVGLGANIIEKGVYDNPDENDQGIMITASFDELTGVIKKTKSCWEALGDPYPMVKEPRDNYTLLYGLTARQKITKGETLTLENVKFAFPALGISCEFWELVNGKMVNKNIEAKNEISWRDIDFKE
jgi:sialic acid synthase SpsE